MISRRVFVGAMAAVGVRQERVVLEAIAAERMPQKLVVRGIAKSPFFELRDYGTAEVGGILNRHGIRPVFERRGKLLFPFESLAAREQAWRGVSADPEWIALHASVREITVYRASS